MGYQDIIDSVAHLRDLPPEKLGANPWFPSQEAHPKSGKLRFLIKNLASSQRAALELLNQEGFAAVPLENGQISLRKKGEREWKVLDPQGLDLADVTDILGDVATGLGAGAGFALGGPAGSGLGAAGVSGLKSAIASMTGLTPTLEEGLTHAAFEGVAGAVLPMAGTAISQGPKQALKQSATLAKQGAKRLAGRKIVDQSAKELGDLAVARKLLPPSSVATQGARSTLGTFLPGQGAMSTANKIGKKELANLVGGKTVSKRAESALKKAWGAPKKGPGFMKALKDGHNKIKEMGKGNPGILGKSLSEAATVAEISLDTLKSLPTAKAVSTVGGILSRVATPLRYMAEDLKGLSPAIRAQVAATQAMFDRDRQAYKAAVFVLLSQPEIRRWIAKQTQEKKDE